MPNIFPVRREGIGEKGIPLGGDRALRLDGIGQELAASAGQIIEESLPIDRCHCHR